MGKNDTAESAENPAVRIRMPPNTPGEFLRKSRIARYMPRWRLASLTGLSEETIRDFESNRAVPSAADIRKLASALGLTEHEALVRARIINPEHKSEEERP